MTGEDGTLFDRRDVLKTTGAGIAGAAVPGAASAAGEGRGPPTRAILTVDPAAPSPGETVTLSGERSRPSADADGIETYAFEVTGPDGDRLLATAGGAATATVELPEAGDYTARLTVTDDADGTDVAERTLDIGFPRELLNPRARNAAHAWERGYRGRADRTVLLPDSGVDARHGDIGPWTGVRVDATDGLSVTDGAASLSAVDPPARGSLPRLVGWLRADGDPDLPRDTSGHGSHCCGIMTGTGRARVLETGTFLERWEFDGDRAEPPAGTLEFVAPGETAGRELFVALGGRWVDARLVGPDGSELATGGTSVNALQHGGGSTAESGYGERAVLTADAVHDAGADEAGRTYTLELTVDGRSPDGTGELERVAASVVAERGTDLAAGGEIDDLDVTGGLTDRGDQALHPGVAPRQSLVATPNTFSLVSGRSSVLRTIGDNAQQYAEAFASRAVSMSWGQPLGVPSAVVQNDYDEVYESIAALARAGLVSAHAVANLPGTPTGGSDTVSGAPEAISVVRTDHLSGISTTSSGGLATVTDDGEVFQTPDVCAYGQDETSVDARTDTEDGEYGEVGGYTEFTGTSMAAPSTAGLAALVMQAMEEDGPAGLDLPAPSALFDEGRDETDRLAWTLKSKATLLATATTTAFNAIPWHGDQAPAYTPGERDPYEGFGRINDGAAVDAVSREFDEEGTTTATLGLDVPDDEQAAAGYITGPGTYEVGAVFDGYEGRDADLTGGAPHIDIVVYDALSPAGVDDDGPATGTPTVVDSYRGTLDAEGDVTVSLGEGDVYQVVVKLVSVPGDGASQLAGTDVDVPPAAGGLLFNGADVQVDVEIGVEETGATVAPDGGA